MKIIAKTLNYDNIMILTLFDQDVINIIKNIERLGKMREKDKKVVSAHVEYGRVNLLNQIERVNKIMKRCDYMSTYIDPIVSQDILDEYYGEQGDEEPNEIPITNVCLKIYDDSFVIEAMEKEGCMHESVLITFDILTNTVNRIKQLQEAFSIYNKYLRDVRIAVINDECVDCSPGRIKSDNINEIAFTYTSTEGNFRRDIEFIMLCGASKIENGIKLADGTKIKPLIYKGETSGKGKRKNT